MKYEKNYSMLLKRDIDQVLEQQTRIYERRNRDKKEILKDAKYREAPIEVFIENY